MANIDDLPIPNFSDLSDEEALELILRIRERRTSKNLPKPRKVAKTVKAKISKTEKLLAKLTPEQLQLLLDRMRKNGT